MADWERVIFHSGGVTCAGRLYRPTHGPRPYPCVVVGHGFSGTMDNLVAYADRFSAAGFAVFTFDYRGFGESGGEPRQLMDTKRQRDDWHAAIHTARRSDNVDSARIALWGSSYSGGHVIDVASTESWIAAVVAQVPLIDAYRGGPSTHTPTLLLLRFLVAAVRDALRGLLHRPPYLVPVFGRPGQVAQFRDPALKPFFDALARESATWRNAFAPRILLTAPRYRAGTAARLTMPLLVCVADNDVNASPSFAVKVAQEAPHGEIKRYPVGHFDVYPEMNPTVANLVISDEIGFLQRHLLGVVARGATAEAVPA